MIMSNGNIYLTIFLPTFIIFYNICVLLDWSIFYYILGTGFIFFYLIKLSIKNQISPFLNSAVNSMAPFLVLTLLFIISSLWSFNATITIKKSLTLLFFIFLTAIAIYESKGNFKWLNILILTIPILSIFFFIYLFLRYGSVRFAIGISSFHTSFSNSIASQNILLIPFLCFKSVKESGFYKIVFFFALVSTIIVMILSQSRGALILGFLSFLISFFFVGKRNLLFYLIFIFSLFFMLFFSNIIITKLSGNQFTGLVIKRLSNSALLQSSESFYIRHKTDAGRKQMYRDIQKILKEHPFIGIGYYGYRYYSHKYVSHSILLTIAEVGILGYFIFGWLIFFIVKKIKMNYKMLKLFSTLEQRVFYQNGILALIIAFVHSFVRPQLQNPCLYIILIILLSPVYRMRN